MSTIEELILSNDKRGMSTLAKYLPSNYCEQAANLILQNPGTTIITTGFYIIKGKMPETDGPLGAIAIGNALNAIGNKTIYITDKYSSGLIKFLVKNNERVQVFPFLNQKESIEYSKKILSHINPSLLISIERCGQTKHSDYRNMRGIDMTDFNARIDHLFELHNNSIGIGDGGNEIGMGNLSNLIPSLPLPFPINEPCITKTTNLIVSTVSNWGGYGLVAALSILYGKNLLPNPKSEQNLLEKCVKYGAVDGVSTLNEYTVDGLNINEHNRVLIKLNNYVEKKILVEKNNVSN